MTIVLSLWLAWQSVSPEAVRHAKAGMDAREHGHLDEAIAEFRQVTVLEPNLAAAFVNLGAAYVEKRDFAAAIPPLRRALELNGELVGAHQMLGYALLAQGDAAGAIPHLERAKAVDALGIAQLEAGKLPEAVMNLEAALAARPNDPDLLYYLGRASGRLSKQAMDALIAGYPDSPRAHEALGENLAALRRAPEAEKEFQEAIRLRPDTPGVHLALGEVYARASDWVKAEGEFRAEAKLRPDDAEAAYELGSALLEEGKTHEARVELDRADALRPEMPETLYALGKARSLDGDAAGAETAWRQVIAIEKNGELAGRAHFGLAGLYRKEGKPAEAAREMEAFRREKKQ